MTLCYLEAKICCSQTKAIIICLWVKSKNSRCHISLYITSPPLCRPKAHITLSGSYEYYPIKWKNNGILNWEIMSINKHRLLLSILSHGASGMIAWLFLANENRITRWYNATNILFADSSCLLLIKLKKWLYAQDSSVLENQYLWLLQLHVHVELRVCLGLRSEWVRVERESCTNPWYGLAETFYPRGQCSMKFQPCP